LQELKAFAVTLQFYSNHAYKFIRKTFDNALPHLVTIRKWFSNVDGSPGFSSIAFQLLDAKAKELKSSGKMLMVSVMLDDMALRKEIGFRSTEGIFNGLVNLGQVMADKSTTPAKEVLVVMAVGINCHFKLPIGYFYINGLNGQDRANLVRIALQKIHETGVQSVSITCDGPSTHFSMLRELGATINPYDVKPFFMNPSNSLERVHIFLDAAHMIKLVRNCLGSEKIIISTWGNFFISLSQLFE